MSYRYPGTMIVLTAIFTRKPNATHNPAYCLFDESVRVIEQLGGLYELRKTCE